jgi:DNA repair exonuclease SbcCD ATPase subunit
MSRMNVKEIAPLVSTLILLAAFGCAPTCWAQAAGGKPTMENVEKQVGEAADAIKRYSADQRDEALSKAKAAMDALDAKIDKLEASIRRNWEKMDQATRRKAQAALDELKRQRKRMSESYGALKQSSAGAWEHVKNGFADSYEDLRDAWQKAKDEFGDRK